MFFFLSLKLLCILSQIVIIFVKQQPRQLPGPFSFMNIICYKTFGMRLRDLSYLANGNTVNFVTCFVTILI